MLFVFMAKPCQSKFAIFLNCYFLGFKAFV